MTANLRTIATKVTVCQLPDSGRAFATQWAQLVAHVRDEQPGWVVLPELPFAPWLSRTSTVELGSAAVNAHEDWEQRLQDLAPAIVLSTRPVDFGNERYNDGFLWSTSEGLRSVHAKTQSQSGGGCGSLGYQSATAPEFTPARVGEINIGFLIGAELTMPENAQAYRGAGLHLLVTPRATAASEFRRHLAAARSAAMQTGAFELSSNRTVGATHESSGWIIAPSGDTLALTSDECPFISRAIELSVPSIDAKTNDR